MGASLKRVTFTGSQDDTMNICEEKL